MKTAGFRIRVEPDLRQEFVSACKEADISAAQVLRTFMRNYIESAATQKQGDLFLAAEPVAKYK